MRNVLSVTLFLLQFISSLTAYSTVVQYPPGVHTVGNVKLANCSSAEYAAKAPEICNVPLNGMADFLIPPPVNQYTNSRTGYHETKKITCLYCKPGSSNGPLQMHFFDDFNVVPIGHSFVVTGEMLGETDDCSAIFYGVCGLTIGSYQGCQQLCKTAWQKQKVRFTCEYSGEYNFDGDPECDKYWLYPKR